MIQLTKNFPMGTETDENGNEVPYELTLPYVDFGTITYCPNRNISQTVVYFFETDDKKTPIHIELITLPCVNDGQTRKGTIEQVIIKLNT